MFVLSDSDRDEFRLLCTNGTQAPLSHYRSCNLGRGPGGGMVTRFNIRKVARKFLNTVQVLFFFFFIFALKYSFVSTLRVLLPHYNILKDSLLLSTDAVWPTRSREAALPTLQLIFLWRKRSSLQRCDR